MDFNKIVLIGLLLLVPAASATLPPIYEVDNTTRLITTLNYNDYPWVSTGYHVQNGATQYVIIASVHDLNTPDVFFLISSEQPTGSAATHLHFFCNGIANTTVNLSNDPNWQSNGYTFIQMPLQLISFEQNILNITTNIFGTSVTNGTYTEYYWGKGCQITVSGESVFINTYTSPRNFPVLNFATPNADLENLIGINQTSGTRGIINAGFDLADMMIIISAMFLFVFFLVFIIKMFGWFISRLKMGQTE